MIRVFPIFLRGNFISSKSRNRLVSKFAKNIRNLQKMEHKYLFLFGKLKKNVNFATINHKCVVCTKNTKSINKKINNSKT